MAFDYSIDLISDLYLEKNEQFDWTGKPTSLFCAVAGNISGDSQVLAEVLEHLGSLYRGVFFIDGPLEHPDIYSYNNRIDELSSLCKPLKNVIYMHNHVVVLNGVAFVAVNGWHNRGAADREFEENFFIAKLQNDELAYLGHTIRNLQLHRDASKIVVISNSIPFESLLFSSEPPESIGVEAGISLVMDTDVKVTHWLYGGTSVTSDIVESGRRFVNNPRLKNQPYWPKRIII